MQEELIKTLRGEIKIVANDVSDLLYFEDVFITRTKPSLTTKKFDQYTIGAIIKSHYSSVLVIVRKLIGKKRNEISLMRILLRLEDNNSLITKDWYAKEWLKDSQLLSSEPDQLMKGFIENIPHDEFQKNFGKAGFLDKAIVTKDISDLENATATIKTYVDKRLAHHDKSQPEVVTEKYYLKALKTIDKLTSKYILLLNQAGMASLKPVLQ